MEILEVTDLEKTYRSPDGEDHRVIDVPRFSMAAGEHMALRGASGSGKTTFLNLIAGILEPDGGDVTIDGQKISAMPENLRDRCRAANMGYVFQTFNLLQGYTALENVLLGMMFGPGADAARARLLLERVGLGNRMNYRPRQLSVGQQQRVAVARALANRPKIVLADEPTGNLDQALAAEAIRLIRGVCDENGAALLVVSHAPEVLEVFGRVEWLGDINRATRSRTVSGPRVASQ